MEEERLLEMALMVFILSIILSSAALIPLGVKWEIEKRVIIPSALVIGILAGMVIYGLVMLRDLSFFQIMVADIFLIAAITISLLLWRFYRDPERIPPDDENGILSPADGKIIYVKKIEKGSIPFSEKNGKKFSLNDFVHCDVLPKGGHLIGIAMSYLDVHVNRAPIRGKISLLKHIKGLFISLKKKEAIIQNERVFSVIDNGLFKVGIVQIASRLVRKIVPYIRQGHEVQRGERIGVIRFGSQVDLILPDMPTLHIEIRPGERVKAGMSIIACFEGTE
ncbi:MAG: phosphatidylserine decarboxylase [Candidatus Hodarchaeota archaeon]